MEFRTIIKCVSLGIASSLFYGCACTTHCSRTELDNGPEVALRPVHFAYDSVKLSPTAKQTLEEDFKNLGLNGTNSEAKILLEGRADERGTSKYNQRLSERRNAEVRKYLISLGANKSQFETRGLGERSPVTQGSNPDAWAKNRSVRVSVLQLHTTPDTAHTSSFEIG